MGQYVTDNLSAGEQVVLETRYHWITFVGGKALASLWISPLIALLTSEFVITNKRLIIKVGAFSVRTVEMNLTKVESVNVEQTFSGRVLGFGDITVIGSGGTRETFRDIANPLGFRKAFQGFHQ